MFLFCPFLQFCFIVQDHVVRGGHVPDGYHHEKSLFIPFQGLFLCFLIFNLFVFLYILELYFTQSENLYFSVEYFNLLIIVITDKLGERGEAEQGCASVLVWGKMH